MSIGLGCDLLLRPGHSLTRFSRNALVTTDTELRAIAAPAKTGDSSKPLPPASDSDGSPA